MFLSEGDICVFGCQTLGVGIDSGHLDLQILGSLAFFMKRCLKSLFLVYLGLDLLLQIQKHVILILEFILNMLFLFLQRLQVVIQVSDLLIGALIVLGASCWLLTALDVLFLFICDGLFLRVSVLFLLQDSFGQLCIRLLHLLHFLLVVIQSLVQCINCVLVLLDERN